MLSQPQSLTHYNDGRNKKCNIRQINRNGLIDLWDGHCPTCATTIYQYLYGEHNRLNKRTVWQVTKSTYVYIMHIQHNHQDLQLKAEMR